MIDDTAPIAQLFRIVREAVHNATKHAQASRITIKATNRADSQVFRIEDDGVGMPSNPSEAAPRKFKVLVVDDHPIGRGVTTQQIAGKLLLSPRTVETHRKNIKRKLNLANGAQLSRAAFQWIHENL